MANDLPLKEESNLTHYIAPKGHFNVFSDDLENDERYIEKTREWGLNKKQIKTEFWYKGKDYKRKVKIKGYQVSGPFEYNTAIVEFEDGNLSCIMPAYLKEMQGSNFGKEQVDQIKKVKSTNPRGKVVKGGIAKGEALIAKASAEDVPETFMEKKRTKKEEKIDLPTDKVHFRAKVKEFSTKFNHFADRDDEVILYEDVKVTGESSINVGEAWSGLSKKLEGLELQEGDLLEFDAKIVSKKFNKEILYKVNNPSKIKKI